MLVSDDVLAFMPHLDCVLLIVAAEVTRPDEVWACQGELAEHGGIRRHRRQQVLVRRKADYDYAAGEASYRGVASRRATAAVAAADSPQRTKSVALCGRIM